MTESTLSRSALAAPHIQLMSRHRSRTFRAGAVIVGLTAAGSAWNGAIIATMVWLLAAGSGRAAAPGLLLNIGAAVAASLLIPIGLIVGITIRSWLIAEDRLAAPR